MEEFQRLRQGVDPQTGEPFGDDVRPVFDLYFQREVPDEGESLIAFIDGEVYLSERSRDAADDGELAETFAYWLSLDEPTTGSIGTPAGRALFVTEPLASSDQDALFVVANFPAYERDEITAALGASAAIQLGSLVVAVLLGLVLAGRVLRPLSALATTARTISETDLSRRISVPGNDEASQIARTFNDMLNRLEHAFGTQRQFMDDAGHELRTPLQVISGHLELLPLDRDPAERRQTVDLVMDEIARMNRIVDDLLLLARAEQPDFVQPEPIDATALTNDVLSKVSALGDHRWMVDGAAAVAVTGDRQRLTQAWMQLADNAVRHTPTGQPIRIGSATNGVTLRMWVHDSGPGVPPDETEVIFDRFSRGSQSAAGGTGLGLSIVQAIAGAHGGSVAVVPSRTGARFEITIPVRRGRNNES